MTVRNYSENLVTAQNSDLRERKVKYIKLKHSNLKKKVVKFKKRLTFSFPKHSN